MSNSKGQRAEKAIRRESYDGGDPKVEKYLKNAREVVSDELTRKQNPSSWSRTARRVWTILAWLGRDTRNLPDLSEIKEAEKTARSGPGGTERR